MVIVCPSCATQYTLDPSRIGDGGRAVRCSQCKTSWFASADSMLPDDAPHEVVIEEGDLPPTRSGARRGTRARTRPAAGSGSRASLSAGCIAITLAIVFGSVAFRVPIVRAAPASASLFALAGLPVNLVGLTLEGVGSTLVDDGGRRELVTEGRILNGTARDLPSPDLDVTVEGAAGETLYRWSAKPAASEIPTGEARPFSIRLASPPPNAARVLVRLRGAARSGAVAPD
jgi:predicted Zn finger-like uncharacterized protein